MILWFQHLSPLQAFALGWGACGLLWLAIGLILSSPYVWGPRL